MCTTCLASILLLKDIVDMLTTEHRYSVLLALLMLSLPSHRALVWDDKLRLNKSQALYQGYPPDIDEISND